MRCRKKVRCVECDRKREPERPVARLIDGSITFVCRQCWRAMYWYDGSNGEIHWYLWTPMLESDRDILMEFR